MAAFNKRASNYALADALDHRAVRKLRATHLGAFLGIVQAALKGEIDPLEANHSTLQYFGKATPRQWVEIREGVFNALRDALPDVREVYRKKLETIEKLAHNGNHNLDNYRKSKALQNKDKREAVNFLPELSAQPLALQPQKAQRYRPTNIDYHIRQPAQDAIYDAKRAGTKPGSLHD